jgi:hypothetical protein
MKIIVKFNYLVNDFFRDIAGTEVNSVTVIS